MGVFRNFFGVWLWIIKQDVRALSNEEMEWLSKIEDGPSSIDGLIVIIPLQVPSSIDEERTIAKQTRIQRVCVAHFTEFDLEADPDRLPEFNPKLVIRLDHERPELLSTKIAVAKVYETLRTINDVEIRADVRDRLLVEIKGGMSLLDADHLSISALSSSMIPALRYIADACSKAALGELAKQAYNQIIQFLFH